MPNFKKYCESRLPVNDYQFEYEDDCSEHYYFEDVDNWVELANEVINNPNKHNKALLSEKIDELMDDSDRANFVAHQKSTMFLVLDSLDNGKTAAATEYLAGYHELELEWYPQEENCND